MTDSNNTSPSGYHFDDVVIDCKNFRVEKNGQTRTLTPRAFDILVFLVARRGRAVEKQELFEQIWKGTFVTDNALTRVIKEIRRAIGDDADAPRYIETIPKRGYRFIAEITQISDAAKTSRPELTERRATPSMAVLPFKLFASNSDDEYLGLGMADALITRLSNVRQIIVRPTSAVLKYAGINQDPVAIGRELCVESVLEGSIRKSGERIRATVQFVSVEDGRPLWADKFDEKFTDIFAVEDSIAEKVADALALRLSGEEKLLLKKRYTGAVEAHEFYLKGRYYANKFTLENFNKSIESFHRALDIDPNYALVYAGIAEAYWIAADLYLNPEEAVKQTKEAAIKAVEIDDNLAEGHAFLAISRMSYDWDWIESYKGFKRAIELNPVFAPTHQWYGWYLSVTGRHDEAIRESERAKQLDPFSLGINWFLSVSYCLARRYDEALEKALDLIELEPNFWAGHLGAGICYAYRSEYTESIAAHLKAKGLDSSPMIKGSLAYVYALAGMNDKARAGLDELKTLEKESFVPPFYLALIHMALRENDDAFAYLEKAYEMRDSSLPLLKVDARLDPLRSDPRLTDLMLRIGLV
ncbi:MAG TPA: winged helix-turn-helix domain-containing protein [Blastocatellia bacterium]|nr:winged helix-turn-helix domain-containing protein [Blastocatellia bacterium]